MHKITLFSCLTAIAILAAGLDEAGTKNSLFETDRSEYYRYQIVQLTFSPDSLLNISPDSVYLAATFSHGDSSIPGVGGCSKVEMRYDKKDSAWHGTWAMPWNPPLGLYRSFLAIYARRSSEGTDSLILSDSATFMVKSRIPRVIPDGFCAMTIESAGNMLNAKLPSPVKNTKHWTNFTDWAKYLGADAVWYSVGWTIENYPKLNDDNPWVRENFRVFPKLAEECHKQGLKFGGYVGSYLLWGPPLRKLKYDYSLETKKGSVYPNHHVSLDDPKRRADIVAILKLLQEDPNVDFIGLDYIRPGAGGFETVDDFVEQMNVEVPTGWKKWSPKDRIRWVAGQVKPMTEKPIRAKWQWWQAHRSATAVEKLINEAGVTKPVWGFTLGWDKGHEHGQDPPMMNDAGLDLDAVMIYESNARQCFEMTGAWSKYLKGDEVQLMAGEQIDWILLQKSITPPAPEEFYWRLTDAIKGTTDGGRVKGLFWHDMYRGIKGRKGPHNSQEWLIAGAAAFSKVKQELGILPVDARIISENGKIGLRIRLTGSINKITIAPMTSNSPGKIVTVQFPPEVVDTTLFYGKEPSRGLVAYRITWGEDHRDQTVTFGYYPRPYAENPFRLLQSFRAGGDLLIATQAGRNTAGKALSAGRMARDNGLVVNKIPLDSLYPSLAYKYSKLLVIFGDSLNISEAANLKSFISLSPEFPIAFSAGKDSISSPPGIKMMSIKNNICNDPEFSRFIKSYAAVPKRNGSGIMKLSLHLDK
jgi:hypothetical protein